MRLGPVQVVVIGFYGGRQDRAAAGETIRRALESVRGRGVIRLVDTLFLDKDASGRLSVVGSGEEEQGGRPYGVALRRLAGIAGPDARKGHRAGAARDHGAFGLTPHELRVVLSEVPPGAGVALVLFEHAWAGSLAAAVREAGGRLLAQGILTRESVAEAGAELHAIAEAEAVMEVADAVRCVPLLDALAYPLDGDTPPEEAASSAVAAETLRALIVAGLIDDAEAEPALATLLEAGLISPETVVRALDAVAAQRGALPAGHAARDESRTAAG